ncbi:hypothetical protein BKI52_06490 [marine bacterium AO1-C]|nr:hypothetical protein BKI52_06490 [marine bacterium AO1-C]
MAQSNNPVFDLFPLSDQNYQTIKDFVHGMFSQMFDEEGFNLLTNFSPNYPSTTHQLDRLSFETFGWKEEVTEGKTILVCQQTGNYMYFTQVQPNGPLGNIEDELDVYRQWVREQYVAMNGGLVFCEIFNNKNGVGGFESITKIPRPEGAGGVDYAYFLNIQNYQQNVLYQVIIKAHEQGNTGLRDNMMMQPMMQITGLDPEELMKHYFRDPYQPDFTDGLRMNATEMEDFDSMFPLHPLTLIRQTPRPRLLESFRWDA